MHRSSVARGVLSVSSSRMALLVLAAAMVSLIPAAWAEDSDLLRNASVEDGVLFTPTAWDTTEAGVPTVRFGWDKVTARSGDRSLYIYNTSDEVPLWHNWSQMYPGVNELGGKKITFRAWVKTGQMQGGRPYLVAQAFRDTVRIEAIRTGNSRIKSISAPADVR